jgi:hypothetical protein
MNPLTVFHLIYSLETGGAEVDLLAKSRVLVQAHGYDVVISCLLKRGELAAQAEAAGIRVLGPLMRGKFDASVIPRLVGLMQEVVRLTFQYHLIRAEAELLLWVGDSSGLMIWIGCCSRES